MSVLPVLGHGFVTAFSLIVAIGAQNTFILRQGLKREHVLPMVLFAGLSDAFLFTLGALGFGSLTERYPMASHILAWVGIAFLVVYGAISFSQAFTTRLMEVEENGASTTFLSILPVLFAVTYLNPHSLLDTLVLVGGIAAQYAWPLRTYFVLGASAASMTWFTSLGFGAGFLAPIFNNPRAWKVLDIGVGLLMWVIAAILLIGEFRHYGLV